MNHRALAGFLLAALAVASCSATGEQERIAPVFVAASSTGAILYDPEAGSYLGYSSDGRRVWTDDQAAICAARCPEAAFSTATRKVLSWLSERDMVVAEGDELRVLRPDGTKDRRPVADAGKALWRESPDRRAALLLYADPTVSGGEILRFRRDARGWRETGERLPSGGYWGACVGGDWAILTGERGGLFKGGAVVPLQVDLDQVGECVVGTAGGAVVSRYVDDRGVHHTEVRGIDSSGRQRWSRDIATRAGVITDPSGAVGLVHGGELELLDAEGEVRRRHADVVAAGFTETGQLVTMNAEGKVTWAA
jgi:hypothetical protein